LHLPLSVLQKTGFVALGDSWPANVLRQPGDVLAEGESQVTKATALFLCLQRFFNSLCGRLYGLDNLSLPTTYHPPCYFEWLPVDKHIVDIAWLAVKDNLTEGAPPLRSTSGRAYTRSTRPVLVQACSNAPEQRLGHLRHMRRQISVR
jgi:hypothetical protein